MNLPWLGVQIVYSHFAWGMVLSACGIALLARRRPFAGRVAAVWLVLSVVACALPGRASPAYWLALAFQQPSALLLACCVVAIWKTSKDEAGGFVLPPALAAGLAAIGLVLYADSFGWLHLGLYLRGFGHVAAVAGLLIGAGAAAAFASGWARTAGGAVLAAALLFALCRLPTGNVWDAFLDPLLWLWSLYSLLRRRMSRASTHGLTATP